MAIPKIFDSVCETNGWGRVGDDINVQLDGGRTQLIALDTFDHDGTAMVRAYSTIGDGSELSDTRMRSALSINFSLPFGALAVNRGKLVLVDTFVSADADVGEVSGSLRSIAETADHYEKIIFGTDEN